jgi:hypothetical protein
LKDKAFFLIPLCLALAGVARAEDWSAWQRAYDPATRTRFIPVELWTGAPWDGTEEIRMTPVTLEFGPAGDKSIKGPTIWHGIQVYERLNRDKSQLFALRDDRTGLGRVFDSRYPKLGCRGEVKFPLGRWKQGEVREYQLDCARGRRPLKVTSEEIDFVHSGVPHSLRFHWLFMEGRGRGTDMRYVYSPRRGLVDVRGNEQRCGCGSWLSPCCSAWRSPPTPPRPRTWAIAGSISTTRSVARCIRWRSGIRPAPRRLLSF